jgi:hypothetical protein
VTAPTQDIRKPYRHNSRRLDWHECRECGGFGRVLDDDEQAMRCEGCGGTGGAQDHKTWCERCGVTGTCPDCNPPDPHDY